MTIYRINKEACNTPTKIESLEGLLQFSERMLTKLIKTFSFAPSFIGGPIAQLDRATDF
jgi:hypothetical protein